MWPCRYRSRPLSPPVQDFRIQWRRNFLEVFMTRRFVLILSLALFIPAIAVTGAPRVLAVRCTALITVASRPPLRDASIVITDGTITAVGAGLAVPAGAEVL